MGYKAAHRHCRARTQTPAVLFPSVAIDIVRSAQMPAGPSVMCMFLMLIPRVRLWLCARACICNTWYPYAFIRLYYTAAQKQTHRTQHEGYGRRGICEERKSTNESEEKQHLWHINRLIYTSRMRLCARFAQNQFTRICLTKLKWWFNDNISCFDAIMHNGSILLQSIESHWWHRFDMSESFQRYCRTNKNYAAAENWMKRNRRTSTICLTFAFVCPCALACMYYMCRCNVHASARDWRERFRSKEGRKKYNILLLGINY